MCDGTPLDIEMRLLRVAQGTQGMAAWSMNLIVGYYSPFLTGGIIKLSNRMESYYLEF